MFGKLQKLIAAVAAIIAIIPGASLLSGLVELPLGFNSFLGLMISILGPIIFFVIFLNRESIIRLSRPVITGIILICTIGGIGITAWLFEYSSEHIASYTYVDEQGETQSERFLVPEKFGPELTTALERDGGQLENVLMRNREETLVLLGQDSRSVRYKTLVGLLIAQMLFIFAFLSAAWATLSILGRHSENEE